MAKEAATSVVVTWVATLSSATELNLSDEARVVVTQADLPGAELTRLESRDASESARGWEVFSHCDGDSEMSGGSIEEVKSSVLI